jgi:hypothetical protein
MGESLQRPHRGDLPIRAILYAKKSPAERRAEQEEDCGIRAE